MDGSNELDIPPTAPEGLMPIPAADEDEIMPPTPSLVYFVLGNFALAMLLISLIILIPSFAVAWLTVFRDARSMSDQVLSNATGVSLSPYFNEHPLLTVVVTIGINTWPRSSAEPRCIRVIHFMDGPRLRSAHRLWDSTLELCPYPYGLQAI